MGGSKLAGLAVGLARESRLCIAAATILTRFPSSCSDISLALRDCRRLDSLDRR